jgi:endo-1,3(4)-beta-glucanase
MLPITGVTPYHRSREFVESEWNTYFSNGRVDQVLGGWRGILYANYAMVNQQAAWNFFTSPFFDKSWLDGGGSRTWYLAFIDAFRCYGKKQC